MLLSRISKKAFNGQFTDVFNKNEHTQVPLLDRSAPFMNDIAVSKDGVIKLLKGLIPSKALGPDELHPRVLKELATELGPVFAHLFQQSIDTGEIPKKWSLANICPLFKKSDRPLACNYRPVSLTCVPCKLLEHIVSSIIMAHLDDFVCCLAHRCSTAGFLLLQCSSGVVRHPRDLQVSFATRFCRVLIFASS